MECPTAPRAPQPSWGAAACASELPLLSCRLAETWPPPSGLHVARGARGRRDSCMGKDGVCRHGSCLTVNYYYLTSEAQCPKHHSLYFNSNSTKSETCGLHWSALPVDIIDVYWPTSLTVKERVFPPTSGTAEIRRENPNFLSGFFSSNYLCIEGTVITEKSFSHCALGGRLEEQACEGARCIFYLRGMLCLPWVQKKDTWVEHKLL